MQNDEVSSTSGVPNPLDFNISSQFSLHEELFSKGYCRLFKAQRYGKWYVLKGLRAEHIADPVYMAMIEKEFASAVTLDHPNIVHTYSLETDEVAGRCFVMECVEGRTLAQFLDENPSAAKRKQVVLQLLDAMEYFHARQIVHRDLKPSNILVTYNGDNVKVIDFGLADADDYAVLKEPAYTRGYAAPEQMTQGAPVDCRTDIYAFGVILRQLFPHRYRNIAARCAAKSSDDRYATASDVSRAIGRYNAFLRCIPLLAGAALLIAIAILFSPSQIENELTATDFAHNGTVQPAQPVCQTDNTMSSTLPQAFPTYDIKPQTQPSEHKAALKHSKAMLTSYADSLYRVWQLSFTDGRFTTQAEAEVTRAFFHFLIIERQATLVSQIETDSFDEYGAFWGILNFVPENFRTRTDNYMGEHTLPQPYDQYASPLCKALSDSIQNSHKRFQAIVKADNLKRWKQFE